jgi:preprotein translocase subunit SecG
LITILIFLCLLVYASFLFFLVLIQSGRFPLGSHGPDLDLVVSTFTNED